MLEEIDFRRDYGEIFAEVKEKVEFIQANKLPDELIKKAQSGDNEAFEKVYFYYMPVIEYFYLKDMPWIDSDYAKKEMVQIYEDAYIKSIMTYSKNGYGSFVNCIRFLVANAKHIGLSRISREEKNDSLTAINDVDKVAEVYGEGLDLKRLTRLIDLLPNEKYREVMEWIASGKPLTKLAQIIGCAKQTLFSRRDYARNELKSLYKDCQTMDWQRNVLNKSIIQICKESGMSRMEVCYLLRVLDYANEKTNIIPEPVKDVETKEREAVAECVLSAYDFQGYKDAYSRYGDNYESAPKAIREDYKNICLVVELARKYMRAVFDSKEGGTRYWKLNGINLGSLRKSDLVFFTRLHSYVMFDTERPFAPCKLKERLIEKLSDMQEVGGEMD